MLPWSFDGTQSNSTVGPPLLCLHFFLLLLLPLNILGSWLNSFSFRDHIWDDSVSRIYIYSPPTCAKLNVPLAPQTQCHLLESRDRSQHMCSMHLSFTAFGAKPNMSSSLPVKKKSALPVNVLISINGITLLPVTQCQNFRPSFTSLVSHPCKKSCCAQQILSLTVFSIWSFYSVAATTALVEHWAF